MLKKGALAPKVFTCTGKRPVLGIFFFCKVACTIFLQFILWYNVENHKCTRSVPIKLKPGILKENFESKNFFREELDFFRSEKRTRNETHEINSPCSNRCLLNFTARKLSNALKF